MLSALVAPKLPPPVLSAVCEIPVGPGSPAGGATVHFGLPRFSSHLDDQHWAAHRAVLEAHGYKTCWSLPIPAMEGTGRLGSLDVYRKVAGMPSEEESRLLLVAARLASIAIEHASKTERLCFNATHDPLTGLGNRVLFAEALGSLADGGGVRGHDEDRLPARTHTRGSQDGVGVLFIDLDRFKLVNDTLGHAFGDDLLRAVSLRLADAVGHEGVVARFGGDEFTVLRPGVGTLDEVVSIGGGLLSTVSYPYVVHDQVVTIGASAGATFAAEPPADAASLVRDADTALYHAKERGRGRVEAFDQLLLSALADQVTVERELRSALASDDLFVEFQPVVHVGTGRATGAEALARCRTRSGHVIAPTIFIPVGEEVGLISRVFDVVLRDACRAAVSWNSGRSEAFVVWVNLAPQQLSSTTLVERIAGAIEAAGATPCSLGFEVTERGILPDPEEAARCLGELAGLGVRLAVDDFGTGHSSLGHLQKLPVDTVKLDRSFVTDAAEDPRSRAIVWAVVELATAIGLTCVAEGVETVAQLDVIRGLGCKIVQGFVYSQPQSFGELSAWVLGPHEPSDWIG